MLNTITIRIFSTSTTFPALSLFLIIIGFLLYYFSSLFLLFPLSPGVILSLFSLFSNTDVTVYVNAMYLLKHKVGRK